MRILRFRNFALSLFCIFSLSISSAKSAPVRLFDADILSSDLVTSISQDREGNLWIATEYGLNKFDGVRFSHYFHDDTDPHSLGSDKVLKVMADADGNIWSLTSSSVHRYDAQNDCFLLAHFPQQAALIQNLQLGNSGELLALNSETLYVVDPISMTATPLTDEVRLLDTNTSNLYIDGQQRYWLWGRKDILLLSPDLKQIATFLAPSNIAGIHEREGRILLICHESVNEISVENQSLSCLCSIPEKLDVRHSFLSSQGELLAASFGQGIYRIDLQANEIVPTLRWEDSSLEFYHQKIVDYFEDRDGNIWLASFQRGVILQPAHPHSFHYFNLNDWDHNNELLLRSVFIDRERHLYFCQEKNGIAEPTAGARSEVRWLPDTTVTTMYDLRNDTFLVGTMWDGFCLLNKATGHTQWIGPRKRVSSFATDRQGRIYTAYFNDGLHCYDPTTYEERPLCQGQMKLHNDFLNTLYCDSEGLIWIGTYWGVEIYQPETDSLVQIHQPDVLRKSVVHAITQTSDNRLWIGSNKGLFAYDKGSGQWQRFTEAEGLSNNFVCGLAEDSARHTLWISTFHGLNRIDIRNHSIANYLKGNGLQQNNYLRGACGNADGSIIVFGDSKGFTYFSPAEITENEFQRGIQLKKILQNGDNVPLDCPLTFAYSDNFTLQFSPMDFREMTNVFYEYRFSDDPPGHWTRLAAGISELSFTHLQPEDYQLEVRACDGGTYSELLTLQISITPPWYKSWWAYTFYIIIGILTCLTFIRFYRHRKEAEVNEAKIRFFEDVCHEIRTPLTLIMSPLDTLMSQQHDVATMHAFQTMKRNTNRLLQLVNQILNIRKIEKEQMKLHFIETDLTQYIGSLCQDYHYLVEKRKIHLRFDDSGQQHLCWIDRDYFDKVAGNLIGNALKYAPDGGEVSIILENDDKNGCLRMRVQDNGAGIDSQQIKHVFERFYQTSAKPTSGQMGYGIGLNLASQITLLHGGNIDVHNRKDQSGTEFVVTLPLGNRHLPKAQLVGEEYFVRHGAELRSETPQETPRRPKHKTSHLIAIVDDDEEMLQFLAHELGEIYQVTTYTNGQSALEGITSDVPDLVVSDVIMPQMDGFEMLKRLKQNTRTSHVPIILLTSKNEQMARISGLEQGADAYIAKPFNASELEASIKGLISNRNLLKGKYSGMQEQKEAIKKVEMKGADEELMERIMRVVNSRLEDSSFNVEVLATEVGLSRVQLHRRMKEMTGISVGDFIRNLRLQQAARLLEKGDVSVSQVTWAIGMSNPTHFAHAFKNLFGVTPHEYMEKHKSKS